MAKPDPALLERAIRLLEKALSIDAGDAWNWSTKGVILKKLGRLDESESAYRRALEHNPKFASARVNLGALEAIRRDISAAERDVRKATEFAELANDRLFAWRTLAAIQLFNADADAVKSSLKAIEADRQDVASWVIRASAELEFGDAGGRDKALESAQYADLLAEERNALAKRVRALIELAAGRFQKAFDHAGDALAMKDQPTINHLIQAVAEAKLGHHESARQHLAQADATWPSDLRAEGSFTATADAGVLWFETYAQLAELRNMATATLRPDSP